MSTSRAYGPITPELRAAAVEAVAALLTGARSTTEAVRVVADNVGVHANSVRAWAIAAGVLDDPQRRASVREQADRLAALTRLNQQLAGIVRDVPAVDPHSR